MKILFVGMHNSVHLARWISQLYGTGWDLHLFPVYFREAPHEDLKDLTFYPWNRFENQKDQKNIKLKPFYPFFRGQHRAYNFFNYRVSSFDARLLAYIIRKIKPDIIHSLEMQHAAYLTLEAKDYIKGKFPRWIYSSWGSDIYYFSRFPEHKDKIMNVLSNCDYLFTDCHRDAKLATKFGFKGNFLGVFPGPGGFKLDAMRSLIPFIKPSKRKTIAIKGYSGWVYRPETIFKAVEMLHNELQNYNLVVYSAGQEVIEKFTNLGNAKGLKVTILPQSSHDEILKLFGQARLLLAASISDGTPNSMLEAMAMGALPIQSDTISTAEWINNGKNGYLFQPEDFKGCAEAIKMALANDNLVDTAANYNYSLLKETIDYEVVRPKVIEAYKSIR